MTASNAGVIKLSKQDAMGACNSAPWFGINCECGGAVRNDIFPDTFPYKYPYVSPFSNKTS